VPVVAQWRHVRQEAGRDGMSEHLPQATRRPRSVAMIDAPPEVGGRRDDGSLLATDVLAADVLARAGLDLPERL